MSKLKNKDKLQKSVKEDLKQLELIVKELEKKVEYLEKSKVEKQKQLKDLMINI